MNETKAAWRRLRFWVRLSMATVLVGWAVRICPPEGILYLLSHADREDLPQWVNPRRPS
jgi:hypothetical protein